MSGTVTPWLSAHHLWGRRTEVRHRPSPVPASPHLAAHERALVHDTDDDGIECVATGRALYWRTHDNDCQWTRVGWSTVDQVGWERATHTLRLLAPHPLELHFAGHPRLPEFAAERVGAAHLMRSRVQLSGSCAATVVAIRDSDSGRVRWSVQFDPSCDTGDPAVTGAMDNALDDLRRQAGC